MPDNEMKMCNDFADIAVQTFKKLLKFANNNWLDEKEVLQEYAGLMCIIATKLKDKKERK